MRFTTRRVGNGFPISNPRPAQVAGVPTATSESTESTSTETLPSRPRHPSLVRLHKFRNLIIPILLMLIFTTLILGAIYAYCVAKPHTSIADQLARDPSAEANDSIFGKRQGYTDLEPASLSPASTSTGTDTTSDGTTSSDNNRDTEPQTALLFYTLSAPAVSLVHLTFELIMHHHTPRHLAKRTAFILLLTSTAVLTAGWITTLSFWLHCEIVSSGPTSSAAAQAVCPIQVRGHFMYGIHEVSIAKAVVGWLVVLAYMWHLFVLAQAMRAQRRVWRIQGPGKTGSEMEMGEATEIVVSVSDQLRKETYLASGGR